MKITLKAARVNAGYSLAQAADMTEVDPSTVCRWERNGSKIPAVSCLKLCEAYGVDIKDIKL